MFLKVSKNCQKKAFSRVSFKPFDLSNLPPMTILKIGSTANVSDERGILGASYSAVHLSLKNAALGLDTTPYAFSQYIEYMLLPSVLVEIINTSKIAYYLKYRSI